MDDVQPPPRTDSSKRLVVLLMAFGTWCLWAPAALLWIFGTGPLGLLMAAVVIAAAVPLVERAAKGLPGPWRNRL